MKQTKKNCKDYQLKKAEIIEKRIKMEKETLREGKSQRDEENVCREEVRK